MVDKGSGIGWGRDYRGQGDESVFISALERPESPAASTNAGVLLVAAIPEHSSQTRCPEHRHPFNDLPAVSSGDYMNASPHPH